MTDIPAVEQVKAYFNHRISEHGATPRGADWNSTEAQVARFDQLLKVVDFSQPFSILDYGCGYAALADYLNSQNRSFQYYGYDIVERMLDAARKAHPEHPEYVFSADWDDFPEVDYAVVSGTFNIRLETGYGELTQYVLDALTRIDQKTRKGFAFNLLTKYSDQEYMKPQLYYADPCFLFDYCKTNFSRNVALLHDYALYDFTILVRKGL